METRSFSLEEKIKSEFFKNLVQEIFEFPPADEFKEKAERDLWGLFAGEDVEDQDKVSYQDLSDSSKNLIALVSEDGEEGLPWWLSSFEWRIKERGASDSKKLTRSFLKENIESYHRDCYILKPELDSSFEGALKNLHNIAEELKDILNLELEKREKFDFNFFEKGERGVVTTGRFKEWFDEVLKKFPPFQEQLTSLLLVYSNVKRDFASEYLDGQILETLDEINMIDSSNRINNRELVTNAKELASFEGDVFDLSLDLSEEIEEIESNFSPFQVLFYYAFRKRLENNSELENRIQRWLEEAGENKNKLEDNEIRDFASVAHISPLYLSGKNSSVGEDRVNLLFGGSRYNRYYKPNRSGYHNEGMQTHIVGLKSVLESLNFPLGE